MNAEKKKNKKKQSVCICVYLCLSAANPFRGLLLISAISALRPFCESL